MLDFGKIYCMCSLIGIVRLVNVRVLKTLQQLCLVPYTILVLYTSVPFISFQIIMAEPISIVSATIM